MSHAPGTPLSTLHIICLIPQMSPQSGHHQPQYTAEEIKVGKRGGLSKVTRLGSSTHLRWLACPCLLTSPALPHTLRRREVGEGVLQVSDELLGNGEDRSWGNMSQSGPPLEAARKGSQGLRVLRHWSSQKSLQRPTPSPPRHPCCQMKSGSF